DLAGMVVAVQAQRGTEPFVVGFVAGVAGGGLAVQAGDRVAAGVAGFGPAVAVAPLLTGVPAHAPRVDGAGRGGGERPEDAGVGGDGFGDAFAADEAGPDDLVGVALIALGARGADRGSAVAAPFVEDAVGHVAGVQFGQDAAGGGLDGGDGAGQADGSGAAGGGFDM